MPRVALLIDCHPMHGKIASSIIGEDISQISCLDGQGEVGEGYVVQKAAVRVYLSTSYFLSLSKNQIKHTEIYSFRFVAFRDN